MINTSNQIQKILNSQLKDIENHIAKIPDGEQKNFIINAVKELRENKTLDPIKFVEQFSKIKGEKVDIESLKNMAQKINK